MGELKPQKDADLIAFVYGQSGDLAIPKPFEQDIFLFRTYVAGTTHVEGMDELAPYLFEGEKLNFFREPDNAYDPQAILIKNADGVKIGYVPQSDNAIFARLMDAGKHLFARLVKKKMRGTWLKITIDVYLKE